MFSVNLFSFNLTSSNRLFDITLNQDYYSPIKNFINTTFIPLVPCTIQHYNFSEEIVKNFHRFNLSGSLCPPLGHSFDLRGRM